VFFTTWYTAPKFDIVTPSCSKISCIVQGVFYWNLIVNSVITVPNDLIKEIVLNKLFKILLIACFGMIIPEVRDTVSAENSYYSIQFTALPLSQMNDGLDVYEQLKAKGYIVYYLKAEIDGNLWMRLRVGVFRSVSEAREFGEEFSQREGFDFFVTKAIVRVDAYKSEYDIITTPSAIWMRENSNSKELFSFSRSEVETIDKLEKSRPVISPDGSEIVFNHDSKNYNIPVKNEKAVNKRVKEAEAFVMRGIKWIAKGDLDNAIYDFNRAIVIDPDFAEAYSNRGMAYRLKGLYDQAISDYNKSLEINPDDAETYNRRGFSWYKKGDLDRAIGDFNRALKINPQSAVAYFNRGLASHKKGEFDRAIEDCNKVLEINPEHSDAYSIRCLVWLDKNELDRAIKDCDKALKMNPQNISALITLGVVWLQKGEFEWACANLEEACEFGSCETLKTVKEKGYCY